MYQPAVMAMILLLAAPIPAQAALRETVEITSVLMMSGDPDQLLITIKGISCEMAISTDGGKTFAPYPGKEIPAGWSTNLNANHRRYVLADSLRLFRSDDDGLSWTNTGASSFLGEQMDADVQSEEKEFWAEYGPRLPARSALWQSIFIAYAVVYFALTFFFLRGDGVLKTASSATTGLFILLLAWALLMGVHEVVLNWTSTQYPAAYWNTSSALQPSKKLGIIMSIAARPLPLMVYLLILWPLLPGSKDVLARAFTPARQWIASSCCVSAGVAIAVLHGWMMFVGYFWE